MCMCIDSQNDYWGWNFTIEDRQKSICEHTLSLFCGLIVGIIITLGGVFISATDTSDKEMIGLGLILSGSFSFIILILMWCFIKFYRSNLDII